MTKAQQAKNRAESRRIWAEQMEEAQRAGSKESIERLEAIWKAAKGWGGPRPAARQYSAPSAYTRVSV